MRDNEYLNHSSQDEIIKRPNILDFSKVLKTNARLHIRSSSSIVEIQSSHFNVSFYFRQYETDPDIGDYMTDSLLSDSPIESETTE